MPYGRERIVSVLGSTSVGKSALTLMLINNEFVENYDPTIAKSYTKKNFELNGNTYSLTVNDTAGLEEQSQIQTMYINSDGFILVYSITDIQSFQIVQTIYNKLCDELNGVKPVVLVGNKSDLEKNRRVTYGDGKKLAESWGAAFLETSAKDRNIVVNVFQTLLKEIDPPTSQSIINNHSNTNPNNSSANNNASNGVAYASVKAGRLNDAKNQPQQPQQQQQPQKCIIS